MNTSESEPKNELPTPYEFIHNGELNEGQVLVNVNWVVKKLKQYAELIEKANKSANDSRKGQASHVRLMRMVSCNTDIMERLGLVEGSLKDSEEYQNLHVDTIKELIETCRDLYADYKMHHDPRIRKVLMKEGLMLPETEEELEIFEKHNPTEKGSCDISAKEMLNRIKQKET